MGELNLRPLADQVIVEPIEEDEITAGGIVLPETARERPQKGTVLAVGPGKRNDKGRIIPVAVVVGDVVLYARYSGAGIKFGTGQEILILHESDILAIVRDS